MVTAIFQSSFCTHPFIWHLLVVYTATNKYSGCAPVGDYRHAQLFPEQFSNEEADTQTYHQHFP
jgi:hypothetical protein